ncbi:MFS transporter, partial [Staphylococcus cohnii]
PDIVNISVSLTSFVTGVFMVVAGNISDRIGKVKMTRIALILSIIGSLMLIISGNVTLLLLGRIVQGFSAAIIMPATISIVNDFFEGDDRQKALSFWSIGAFGGTGLSSFFAGAMATFISWQSILVLSILLSLVALLLVKNLPESKQVKAQSNHFDYIGLTIFVIMIASI